MAKQRLRHLENLRFRRERGSEPEQSLFTQDGRLNLYGFNRIFSSITQLVASREFGLFPSQACFYYSAFGAELINRYSNTRKQARSAGSQIEYAVNFAGKHYGHWSWYHGSDLLCDSKPSQYHKALHVISQYGSQVIDFQSPAFLNYKVSKEHLTFITPVMFDKSEMVRFRDWEPKRKNGLSIWGEWRPTHHKNHWLKPKNLADIQYYMDRIIDLFEQRIICKELERFNGMDELDYTKRESYIWTDDQ